MTVTLTDQRAGRTLVDPALFDRLAQRVAADAQFDTPTAERIVDQALAFLAACAASTAPLSPSRLVDHGWHAFILHTREYAEFCDRLAGRFIHHVPTADEAQCQMCNACQDDSPGGGDSKAHDTLNPARTANAIAEAGYTVDPPMWDAAGGCSQCHNGCHGDPAPNPPPNPDAI